MKTKSNKKPTLVTLEQVKSCYANLAEIQTGRVTIVKFAALAESARNLDPAYMEELATLFRALTERQFNGSLISESQNALRQTRT